MANIKITDLTAYTDAASTDVLPIVDVSADVTKKIAIGDIVKAVPQGTAALPGLAFDGDPNTGIYSPGADQVAISTNGTGRLFIDASGNVGVGQSGGARGGSGTRFLSKLASGQSFIEVQANGTADANALIFSDGSTGNYGAYGYDHSNDSAYIQTAGLTRLTIDSSGRLGIGTTPNASSIFQAKAATNSHVAIWDYSATPMILGLTDAGASQSLRIAGFPLTFTGNGGAGSEHARITSDGKLGLGTSSPSSEFHAVGGSLYSAIKTGSTVYIGNTGTGIHGRLGVVDSLGFGIQTAWTGDNNGYNLLLNPYGGKVGIGTTSPGFPFQVKSTTNAHVAIWDNGGIPQVVGVNDANGSTELRLAGQVLSFTGNGGAGSEHARITSSGQLLVGTPSSYGVGSSAAAKLQTGDTSGGLAASFTSWSSFDDGGIIALGKAKGGSVGNYTILSDGDTVGQIRFAAADGTDLETNAALIQCQIDGTPGANDMPGRLVFSTTADGASSPTERMRIDSSGTVLIGVNTKTIAQTTNPFVFFQAQATTTTSGLTIESYGNNIATRYHFGFTNPNGVVGTISTNGSATAYNTSSDYRLKENVVPLTGAVDRVNQLQVHRFNFIADPDKIVDGFIAHEAQAVVPECVTGTKDEVDEDGNPVYQGIDQSKLVPLLTAALQEALAEIESLKARVTALEP